MALLATFLWLLSTTPQDTAIADDARPDRLGWPRAQTLDEREIVVFQPHLEAFRGNLATARTAVLVVEGDQELWCSMVHSGRLATDRARRLVQVYSGTLDEVLFPPNSEATAEQRTRTENDLRPLVEGWEPVLDMDAVLVALEFAEVDELDQLDAPPDPLGIEVRNKPVILVHVRGEPRYQAVYGVPLEQVVNTEETLLHDPGAGTFHLWYGGRWWNATGLEGPWQAGSAEAGPLASITGHTPHPGTPLPPDTEIMVRTRPTAVIQMRGRVQFQAIAETKLSFLLNCDSDVFRLEGSPTRYYALMNGRWYVADLLPGPWEPLAPGALPEEFREVPPGSDKGHVLASVPDTREAQDALLDALIPQTAFVRQDSLDLSVSYHGEPSFVPVEGTSLQYAPNSDFAVVKSGERYYCCFQAVWFEAASPEGPWVLTHEVPGEIYDIPSANPLYHVTYARVYQVLDDEIVVGYTPGYLGSYAYQGTLVYGTGHDSGWAGFAGWGPSGFSYRFDPYRCEWVRGDRTRAHGEAFENMNAMFAAGPGAEPAADPEPGARDPAGAGSDAKREADAIMKHFIDGKALPSGQKQEGTASAGRLAKVKRPPGAVTSRHQEALRRRLAEGYRPPEVPKDMRYQKDAFATPDGNVFVVEDNIWSGNHGPDAQRWNPIGMYNSYRRDRHYDRDHRRHR